MDNREYLFSKKQRLIANMCVLAEDWLEDLAHDVLIFQAEDAPEFVRESEFATHVAWLTFCDKMREIYGDNLYQEMYDSGLLAVNFADQRAEWRRQVQGMLNSASQGEVEA